MDGFDWNLAAPIILSSVLLSSLVTWGLEAFRDWLNKRQRAKFLQLRLSVIFEAYAAICLRNVELHQSHVASGGRIGEGIGLLPTSADLPDMPDVWPLIDTRLADRALQFEVLIDDRNTSLDDYLDIIGELDLDQAVKDHLELGLDALVLSRDLRHRADLRQTEIGEALNKRLTLRLAKMNEQIG